MTDAGEPRRAGGLALTMSLAFTVTGGSALALQVIWQRVIALNNGVDLSSTTTVVAAFLAGLGLGSIAGGRLADRLGPTRSLGAFALANVAIGAFAWFSVPLFYAVSGGVGVGIPTVASFALNFALVLVPTVLMGLSLPLVARAVTARVDESGRLVGRLYGFNTLGAAVGSLLSGWFLMGRFGFVTSARIAGLGNLAAAAVTMVVARPRPEARPESTPPLESAEEVEPADRSGRVWRWYVMYGLSGTVAIGLEQVFFRLVDTIMRSNAYSFALVLALYLAAWGSGAALGSLRVARSADPLGGFLRLQFAAGVAACLALVALIRVLPDMGLSSSFNRWFNSDGFAAGEVPTGSSLLYGLILPGMLMCIPVGFIGASYPFVQALVSDRLEHLGRRTGGLVAANVVGNVIGAVVTGFVLIGGLGSALTYRILTLPLIALGIVLWRRRSAPARPGRPTLALASLVVGLVAWAALPSQQALWSFMVGAQGGSVLVGEDRACASVLELYGESSQLVINGAGQNSHPFDDFHVLIGLMPSLVQERPARGLAVGFGVGSSTFSMLSDRRLDEVTTVELCGGAYDVAREYRELGSSDHAMLFDDDRSTLITGDGRRYLMSETEPRFDAVVVDTLRPTSANAGSHNSVEFYEIVADRLTDGGVLAQWVSTTRVLNSAAQVFPYVVTAEVGAYNGSTFMLASRSPIEADPAVLLERFAAGPEGWYRPDQERSLRSFLEDWAPACVTDGRTASSVPSDVENRDLFPRDEFFRDNFGVGEDRLVSTCVGR